MKFTFAIAAFLCGATDARHHRSIAEKMMVNLGVTPDTRYYEDYDTFFLPKQRIADEEKAA